MRVCENREEKIKRLLDGGSADGGRYSFEDLVLITEILRCDGGCPWDMEQTHKSIRNDFIEEAYEVIEAIDTDDPKLLREELGDVMLNVVFHARIEDENRVFNIYDVIHDICVKMIHRHPHVFADVDAKDTAQVLKNWEAIKGEEKQRVTVTDKLRAIPPMYPSLLRAQKVGKKAACFDFSNIDEVYAKLYEEIDEVRAASACGSKEDIAEELGDLLLTVTSLARKLGVNAEESLYHATDKFIDRFERLECEVASRGKDIERMTMPELDAVWDDLKHKK